jgi:hypothetical protein
VVIPAVEAGLQRGTLVMQPAESSLQSKDVPLSNQQSTISNLKSYIRYPVQKQGRPVPNQRSGQAERLRNTRSRRFKTPRYRGKAKRLSTKGSLAGRFINSQPMRIIENGKITKPSSKK